MTDLNAELNGHAVADFEGAASGDTSTNTARFSDAQDEIAAIAIRAAARIAAARQ